MWASSASASDGRLLVGIQATTRVRLSFRYKTDHILVESARNHIGVDVAYKSILVFAVGDIAYYVIVAAAVLFWLSLVISLQKWI